LNAVATVLAMRGALSTTKKNMKICTSQVNWQFLI